MTTMTLSPDYGLVIFSCSVSTFIVTQFLGGDVMKARKAFDVPYPNLYATPGFHKKADEFNRVQRGHQSVFESLTPAVAMCAAGGLIYPRLSSVFMHTYLMGSVLFLKGYADVKLDVKNARYKKGGVLKPIGLLGLLVTSGMASWAVYKQ
jgi:glutathione S-transferase